MKRQKAKSNRVNYSQFFEDGTEEDSNDVQLNPISSSKLRRDVIEAQIQDGDTLQAICLRYNCTLSEIKRLNKIEKEIEIHARTTIRIPITPHTVLLDTLPQVHTSGNSSPKHITPPSSTSSAGGALGDNQLLSEKLFIASVSTSVSNPTSINDLILNTKITPSVVEYRDEVEHDAYDDVPQPRPIPVRRHFDLSLNCVDCDLSWVFLFICILLFCVAIPLIYVFWKVEHLEAHHIHDDFSLSANSASVAHVERSEHGRP